MNTLELMVKEIYDRHGYLYNDNVIRSVAEYIEIYNANKDEDEDVLTPDLWFKHTFQEFPGEFETKETLMMKICDHFLEQRELCLEQTGCLPCYEDFAEEMDSDTYKLEIGQWADTVDMKDVINYLLDWYKCSKED